MSTTSTIENTPGQTPKDHKSDTTTNTQTEDNRNQFMKEASEVNVPTSILMNQFRDNLNQCIERSQLHVECILEILRTACVSMEQTAAEIAAEEYSVYSGKIEELKKKYNIE